MIKVDTDKEHRFSFTQKALAELLVDVLRFDGESIPDEAEVLIREDSTYGNDFNIILSFQQSDLDNYLQEMADKEKDAKAEAETWSAEDSEKDDLESDGTAKPDDADTG